MILIVDDKPENLFSLRTILERNGFEVETASSGEEALKRVLQRVYALIILDVQMPDMDGFEVAEALAGTSRTRHTPIIFLSAVNTDKKFIAKGFASGAIDYITKPVDPDILILRVRTFTRLYEQTAALEEAHHKLQQAHTELHLTLESIPQIAFTARADGRIDFVNQYWLVYAPSKDSFPQTPEGEERFPDLWNDLLATGGPGERELRIRNLQTGHFVYHLLRVTPVRERGRVIKWTGVLVDIHQQKAMNEVLEEKIEERTRALIQSNRSLEASNADLQQFASVASHDLKEPLRKIHLFGSRLREHVQEESPMAGYLGKIMQASARMNRLVNDVLSFSRLSVAHAFEPTDLGALLREVLVDLELSIAEKGARVQMGPMPVIEVIPGLFRQVFQNLVSNALKFSKEGESPMLHITSEYTESLEADATPVPEGPFCRLRFEDNGIGFNARYSEKIFSLFQRLHAREQYEGTGIGLSIARKIVEKHNGSIMARGEENKGATFMIVLPVRQPALP